MLKTSVHRTFALSLALLAGALWSAAPVQARGKDKKKDHQHVESQSRQINGRITGIKHVEVRGANVKNTVVMVQSPSNQRRMVVDLGPARNLPSDALKVGQQIDVQGRTVQIRERRFLVAESLKAGGRTFNIDRREEMSHGRSAGA